ncbi:MAG TPA: M81 family metallopeptidase [Aliidongia sp.]|uniref:M81 family metallopeptidase n=1 Tax=Aliidongia sp. TaxID=1914230 RepID=UPI002DDCE7A6|nr:M81 family metallopeptidase [Aliidongia sp.]HEV2675129.1 M81 family metallopeptidase [Aliidongia sp.]
MTASPIRIAVLKFSHETVTFLPYDTTVADFTFEGSPARGEALLGAEGRSYLGGFVKVAHEFDGVELVGITSPLEAKTGSGSGWLTHETYEHFVGTMIAEIAAAAPFDGVYLSLHGAMAVRGVARPEAELARRVREVVGPKAFIAATFDPHGNEDAEFLRHADLAFTVKYFPHYDDRLQGERAARMLVRAIRGDYVPAAVTVKVPIISPTVLQWTGASPWMDLVQRALTWEAREPDVTVNFFFGFPWADVPDVGMTFQVTTNGRPELARRIARDMAQTAWRQREALLNTTKIHLIKDGVALARQAVTEGRTPVVLADHSDRSGYATWLLREIIDGDLAKVLVATVTDAQAIDALLDDGMKAGDAFDREIGGLADPSAGQPVRVQGTVLRVTKGLGQNDGDRWVQVGFGRGNVLVISRYLTQVIETTSLVEAGLDPGAFDVIALKSRVHFRRGFDDTGFARTILLVEPDQPFLGTVRLEGLVYETVDLAAYYPYGTPAFDPDDI